MRFQNILLASLLGLSSAYTIPEGTEDGVYEHYLDSTGNEVHVKIANATNYDDATLSAYARTPLPGRFKRDADVPSCSGGPEMDHAVSFNVSISLSVARTDTSRTLMLPMPTLIDSATLTLLLSLDTTSTRSVVDTLLSSATLTTSTSTNVLRVLASTPAASSRRDVAGTVQAGPTMHPTTLAMATMMLHTSAARFWRPCSGPSAASIQFISPLLGCIHIDSP